MRKLAEADIDTIVLHTTAGSKQGDVQSIRDFHVRQRGWPDIGYHFVVTWHGEAQVGRSANRRGAHALEWNHRSLGVAMAGHHDHYAPSGPQFDTVVDLIALLCHRYDIDPPAPDDVRGVIGHRETGARKSCPGTRTDMAMVRRFVGDRYEELSSPLLRSTHPLTSMVGIRW